MVLRLAAQGSLDRVLLRLGSRAAVAQREARELRAREDARIDLAMHAPIIGPPRHLRLRQNGVEVLVPVPDDEVWKALQDLGSILELT